MGKASRWFRNLLGLKKTDHHISQATQTSVAKQPSKKRWSLVKSSRETSKCSSERVPALPLQSPVLDDGDDPEKHAIAVAAATAAVAEAAVAAEHAAAEVVKLTSAGRGYVNSVANVGGSGLGSRENWAAVNIQSHFRAYLSRRALRALKALVKLQALVRGYIVRKQEAQKLRRMQAISRAQARARALRAQIYESSNSSSKSSHFHHPGPATPEKYEHVIRKSAKHEQASMLKRNGSRSNGRAEFDKEKVRFNYSMDEGSWEQRVYSTSAFAAIEKNDKILEMDTGKPHVTPKKRNLFQSSLYPSASDPNSLSFTTSKDSTFHLTVPSPSSCEVQSLSPQKFTNNFEENFCTAENSPQFYSASSKGGTSMRGGPFTPTRSDTSRSYLSGYSDVPNYMSYTESSKAKVRSLSAPRQRSPLEISSTTKRFSVHGGYGDMRSYSTHRVSYANFTSKAYPGSGRLDRLGMPVGGDGVGFSGGLRNNY